MAAKKPAGAKRRQGHDPAEHAAPQERAAGNAPSGAAALDSTQRGSSGVEHGLHTPKVAGSSPALASKTHADWEAIERDYRAGVLSLREIAIPNGITEGAIRKRAKRDGWERASVVRAPQGVKAFLTPSAEKPRAGFIYVIYLDAPGERFYKIGMSSNFNARFDAHRCASPFDIAVACAYFVGDMRSEESYLHRRFSGNRVRGEWFKLTRADVDSIAARGVLI